MAFDRQQAAERLGALAARGVYVGTSSWKYAGWLGTLFTRDRYVWRGKFAESRFERQCLEEYAEVFRTVCVDAAYYKFPDERYLQGLMSLVPAGFQFGFKVTDEITIRKFTQLPRFGPRAGQLNENFLNADLFVSAFLEPCEPFRERIGLLMFEFSRFYPSDFARGRDFVEALDGFLGRLPKGWPYGVEIRNRNFLHADYFAVLARHGVTHVLNSWQAMPSVAEQMRMDGVLTTPDRVAARFLLKPGRDYQEAVDLFSPYDRLKEPVPEARSAGTALIRAGVESDGKRKTFVYVNNRLEGNALETIAAMVDEGGGSG